MWELMRSLHLLAMAYFVGGQLLLAAVILPTLREGRRGPLEAPKRVIIRRAARRFAAGSLVALAVLAATGVAMASEYADWERGALHVKLALVALVTGLIVWHTRRPERHAIEGVVFLVSLAIVWLGVQLAHA
jgi:uncharacterized membrane protein